MLRQIHNRWREPRAGYSARGRWRKRALVVAAAALCFGGVAGGETRVWDGAATGSTPNPNASGPWTAAEYWNPDGVPASPSDAAVLPSVTDGSERVISITGSGSVQIGTLTMAQVDNGRNHLSVSNEGLHLSLAPQLTTGATAGELAITVTDSLFVWQAGPPAVPFVLPPRATLTQQSNTSITGLEGRTIVPGSVAIVGAPSSPPAVITGGGAALQGYETVVNHGIIRSTGAGPAYKLLVPAAVSELGTGTYEAVSDGNTAALSFLGGGHIAAGTIAATSSGSGSAFIEVRSQPGKLLTVGQNATVAMNDSAGKAAWIVSGGALRFDVQSELRIEGDNPSAMQVWRDQPPGSRSPGETPSGGYVNMVDQLHPEAAGFSRNLPFQYYDVQDVEQYGFIEAGPSKDLIVQPTLEEGQSVFRFTRGGGFSTTNGGTLRFAGGISYEFGPPIATHRHYEWRIGGTGGRVEIPGEGTLQLQVGATGLVGGDPDGIVIMAHLPNDTVNGDPRVTVRNQGYLKLGGGQWDVGGAYPTFRALGSSETLPVGTWLPSDILPDGVSFSYDRGSIGSGPDGVLNFDCRSDPLFMPFSYNDGTTTFVNVRDLSEQNGPAESGVHLGSHTVSYDGYPRTDFNVIAPVLKLNEVPSDGPPQLQTFGATSASTPGGAPVTVYVTNSTARYNSDEMPYDRAAVVVNGWYALTSSLNVNRAVTKGSDPLEYHDRSPSKIHITSTGRLMTMAQSNQQSRAVSIEAPNLRLDRGAVLALGHHDPTTGVFTPGSASNGVLTIGYTDANDGGLARLETYSEGTIYQGDGLVRVLTNTHWTNEQGSLFRNAGTFIQQGAGQFLFEARSNTSPEALQRGERANDAALELASGNEALWRDSCTTAGTAIRVEKNLGLQSAGLYPFNNRLVVGLGLTDIEGTSVEGIGALQTARFEGGLRQIELASLSEDRGELLFYTAPGTTFAGGAGGLTYTKEAGSENVLRFINRGTFQTGPAVWDFSQAATATIGEYGRFVLQQRTGTSTSGLLLGSAGLTVEGRSVTGTPGAIIEFTSQATSYTVASLGTTNTAVGAGGYTAVSHPKLTIVGDGTLIIQELGTFESPIELVITAGALELGGHGGAVGPRDILMTAGLTLGHGVYLQLADNDMVVDYVEGATPFNTIRDKIIAAYAGNAWTGIGIRMQPAFGEDGSRRGLGYAEASDVLGEAGGAFSGATVDGTAVLVKYTWAGDADLNGTVNFADQLRLVQNYGGTEKAWSQGDFNYDGFVNFTDLLYLTHNYNRSGLSPEVPFETLSEATTPEPAWSVFVLASLCAVRRSRGKRGA